MDFTDVLTVKQAAERLDLAPSELSRWVRRGDLQARKLGSQWFIPTCEVERARYLSWPVGRPFSERASWGILQLLNHEPSVPEQPSRIWQLRRALRDHADDVEQFAGKLRSRAERQLFYAHPAVMPTLHDRIKQRDDIMLSGLSALGDMKDISDLLPGHDTVEAYVQSSKLPEVRSALGLVDDFPTYNVVLHVVNDEVAWPRFRLGVAPPALVALDLLESGEPRAVNEGRRILREQLAQCAHDGR